MRHQRNWANQAIKKLKQYPPPTGGRYERTFLLRDSWEVRGPDAGREVLTVIVNTAPYARFVYGDETGSGQVAVHQGRWITIPEAIERDQYMAGLRKIMRDNIGS